MEQNVVEDLVIPEVPKVISNQEMYVYVPIATHENKGIANFDSYTLTISNGKVSVKESFVDGKIDNRIDDRIVQGTGQNSNKVISQKIITKLLEDKASKDEVLEIANTAAEEKAKSVAKETAEVYVDNNAASYLEFAIDNSTFVLTAKLKNGKGEVLGEVQTVDLPLESVVVNGTYDNDLKKIILTLQNGNTVYISIADLINGLVSEEYFKANASLLTGGTPIAEGTDLNTLTTAGNYYFSSSDQVFTLLNCPIISAFTMKVFYSTENSGYYLKQEIKQYNTAGYLTRHSEDAGSTWSPWSRYATTSDVVLKSGGTITGSLVITDDLIVQGTTTSVDTQNLKVKDKLIYVAKDNTTALSTPAGLITPYYDGENSGGIIYDNTGTAYVGDVVLNSDGNVDISNSNVWPLCARDKSNNWVNGHVPVWDSTNEKLVDSGSAVSIDDIGGSIAKRQSDGTLLVGTTTGDGNGYAAINREYFEARASLLKGGTPIAENTDLNTLTTPGNYYCTLSTTAATLVNCPVRVAFTTKVYYATGTYERYLKQEIKQFNSPAYFVRYSDTGTWSSWVRYTTSDEVVLNTTNQSISGIKTFSDGIKSNKTPTADNDVVRLTDLNNAISQAVTTALNTQV